MATFDWHKGPGIFPFSLDSEILQEPDKTLLKLSRSTPKPSLSKLSSALSEVRGLLGSIQSGLVGGTWLGFPFRYFRNRANLRCTSEDKTQAVISSTRHYALHRKDARSTVL